MAFGCGKRLRDSVEQHVPLTKTFMQVSRIFEKLDRLDGRVQRWDNVVRLPRAEKIDSRVRNSLPSYAYQRQ